MEFCRKKCREPSVSGQNVTKKFVSTRPTVIPAAHWLNLMLTVSTFQASCMVGRLHGSANILGTIISKAHEKICEHNKMSVISLPVVMYLYGS